MGLNKITAYYFNLAIRKALKKKDALPIDLMIKSTEIDKQIQVALDTSEVQVDLLSNLENTE